MLGRALLPGPRAGQEVFGPLETPRKQSQGRLICQIFSRCPQNIRRFVVCVRFRHKKPGVFGGAKQVVLPALKQIRHGGGPGGGRLWKRGEKKKPRGGGGPKKKKKTGGGHNGSIPQSSGGPPPQKKSPDSGPRPGPPQKKGAFHPGGHPGRPT